MGELFAHFEAWDVQAIRKEAREEAREEARKEVQRKIQEARKEVTQQVTKQVTEENIKRVVKVVQELGGTRKIAEQQLMKLYQLTEEEASETVDACWE